MIEDIAVDGLGLIGAFSDLKLTAETVATNPKILWSVLSFGYMYHKASVINARGESIEEHILDNEERKELDIFIREKTQRIEDIMWHGLDKYRNSLEKDGITSVMINHGNDILQGKSVSDIKRDYHQALGKEAVFLGDRLLDKTVKRNIVVKDETSREKFIDSIAEGQRNILLSKTHKRAGYNEGLEQMENESLPFEVFRGIISDIIDEADLLESAKNDNIKKLRNQFKVNPLNVVKMVVSIIGNIREKRWKRKSEKR